MKNILSLIGALILSMLLLTACTQPQQQPPENSDPIALGDAVVVYGTDNHSLGASQIYAATVKTQHGVAKSPKSAGNADGGYMYVFAFLYEGAHRPIDQGYDEIVWGSGEPQTVEAEKYIKMQFEAEADSLRKDSTYETIGERVLKGKKTEE